MVTVGDYKLKKTGEGQYLDGLFLDTRFYMSDNGIYEGRKTENETPEWGLVFEENDD